MSLVLLSLRLASAFASSRQAIGIGQAVGAIASIQRGELDAIANVDPVLTELELNGTIRIVADGRTPEGSQAIFGGSFPAGCLYTTEKFIQSNPRTVQALANAIVLANARMLGASSRQLLRTVYLPSATSCVFSGQHTSVGLAFIGVVVGEYLGSAHGIG